MGVPASLKSCLEPNVDALREALGGEMQLGDWLGDPDLDLFEGGDRESATFAFGYIQGVADAYNKTMIEVLDAFDFDLNL
jgi:hypothetical protein